MKERYAAAESKKKANLSTMATKEVPSLHGLNSEGRVPRVGVRMQGKRVRKNDDAFLPGGRTN